MELVEVPSESKITITLTKLGQKRTFNTRAITAYEHGLLVEPVFFAGLPLDHSSDADLRVVNSQNGTVSFFHADSITQIQNWGGTYHLITGVPSQRPGVQRRGERFKIEMLAKISIGNGPFGNAIIHDMSFQGISFMLGNGMTCNVGDEIHIKFKPTDALNEIRIECVVKRLFKIGNFLAAGCQIMGYNPAVVQYIFNHRTKADEGHKLIGES
ncbi:MAG: PilZ domain-containing protein [Butyrivibrio sp.]|nr:PilZ domain-containing protein [Butyrivibrio sp.]